jgi:uncharacterized membrane protein YqjE
LALVSRLQEPGARSFPRILHDIANHFAEIVRSEVRLGRLEVRQDLEQVAKASALLGIAAIFALYGLGFILLGVIYALGMTSWRGCLQSSWALARD